MMIMRRPMMNMPTPIQKHPAINVCGMTALPLHYPCFTNFIAVVHAAMNSEPDTSAAAAVKHGRALNNGILLLNSTLYSGTT